MLQTTRRAGIAILVAAIVAACAPPPPKQPDPTVAQVTITASADANSGTGGTGYPTQVVIYALKPGAPFETAGYDVLTTGGELGELGQTMTRIAQMVMVAGKSSKKVFELPEGTAAIGVAAGFRAVETAQWRGSAPVKANEVTLLKVNIGANQVTVE